VKDILLRIIIAGVTVSGFAMLGELLMPKSFAGLFGAAPFGFPGHPGARGLDGRWKGTILWRLEDGPRRTSELKRSIPGITERMLIRHLQELVADGIVKRDDKKTITPCVYYSLSSYGRTLGPVVQMMCNWGRSHLKRLSAKR
jgi:DNA-binding HxlR family transcriptional regulator